MPLVRAVDTTQRIAAGDLDARMGTGRHDYPELQSLAGGIDSMAANLGRLRNTERQFLLSVSHELRTPLTSIRGYAEAIADGAVADTTHAAAVITTEARRLERLVADLLDLAKLDARSFSFHLREVDAAEVVEEAAEELRPVLDEAGLTLWVDNPGGPQMVVADPDRLDQVLANLLENAAKFAQSAVSIGAYATQRVRGARGDRRRPGDTQRPSSAGSSTGTTRSTATRSSTGRPARGSASPSRPSWRRRWAPASGPSRRSAAPVAPA